MGAIEKFGKKLESNEIEAKDLILLLAALEELSRTNEDVRDELEDYDDNVIQLSVPDVFQVYIII